MALANPALKTEDRQSESDVVIIIIDRTSSQQLKNRPNQNVKALETNKIGVEITDYKSPHDLYCFPGQCMEFKTKCKINKIKITLNFDDE
jgi:uncharacterized protein (UPF0248 family)